jgi:hypothetical protein
MRKALNFSVIISQLSLFDINCSKIENDFFTQINLLADLSYFTPTTPLKYQKKYYHNGVKGVGVAD